MSTPGPLDGLRFSLVGAGRVGGSVAHWARGCGARLQRVASRSRERAAALAARLGGEDVDLADLATAEDDLLLLAVADPALAAAAARLASRPQAAVALHTSGLYGEEVLSPLAEGGSEVGAWHPLLAFPAELTDVGAAEGAVFALAGSPAAERLARRLTAAFGGRAVAVPAASRPAYHAAAALAAGGLVAVVATAADVAARSGLPGEVLEGYLRLARGALEGAASARPPIAAATGPAARGDAAALERHLDGLTAAAPEAVPLAVELALATLRLQAAARPLSAAQEATRRWLEGRRR